MLEEAEELDMLVEEADILLLNMGFQSLREIMFRLLLEEVADQHLMAVPHLLA